MIRINNGDQNRPDVAESRRSARWMASLAVGLLAMVLAGCDAPGTGNDSISLTEALVVDTTGFARADPAYSMQFPADHGAHPDFYLEWWYFTGNLETEDGRDYGYQFTIFRNALAPPTGGQAEVAEDGAAGTPPSEWRTSQLYSAHLAIADPQTGEFRSDERYARGAAGLSGAKVEDGSVSVWVEDWTMMATEDLSEIRLEAAAEDMALSLVLAPAKPIFFQGENGYSPKGREDGQASHYYSITRLDAAGTVRVGEELAEVSGASWFDREWSTSLLSEDQEGWDWFSLQLDSGEDLMYFRLRSDVQDYVDGSLVALDGSRVEMDPDGIGLEVTDSWESPRTGIRYPIAWRMQIPERGMDLTIEAALPNQELETRITYWEGMVRVSGTRRGASISGKGYVEMTGYGS